MSAHITTYVTDALALLPEQYKGKPLLAALLTAYMNQAQPLEDTIIALRDSRSLFNATGVLLDNIGNMVGLARSGSQSDALYRSAIQTRIGQNNSEGQPELIIQIFSIITGATKVQLLEQAIASFSIMSEVPMNQSLANSLIASLKVVAAAAVSVESIGSFDPTQAFTFAGDQPGLGFDDGSGTMGGLFATGFSKNDQTFAFAGDDTTGLGFGAPGDPLVGGVFTS